MQLEGQLAWITGASRGIGAAIAKAMAAEGARVLLTSRKLPGLDAVAGEIRAAGGEAFTRTCHNGKPEQIKDTLAWAEAELGLPDVLVNNAATSLHFGPMLTCPESMWEKTFEVNVRGPFQTIQGLVARWEAKGRGGSIINVASIQGLRGAPLQGVYAMTKSAVISMTRTLAMELGRKEIRINAIAPGLVNTKLAGVLTSSPEISRMYTDRAALGRYAEPEEIAGMAVYLASSASSYVTGQVFTIDGGYTAT